LARFSPPIRNHSLRFSTNSLVVLKFELNLNKVGKRMNDRVESWFVYFKIFSFRLFSLIKIIIIRDEKKEVFHYTQNKVRSPLFCRRGYL
jgi:hypothetical protein